MEVDPTLVIGAVGASIAVGGVILGYGELKTKVVSLMQRADAAQQSREKQFERLNKLEKDTEVQRTQINALTNNNDELFRLHEKTNAAMTDLNVTLQGLTSDVHYIKDFIKKTNG